MSYRITRAGAHALSLALAVLAVGCKGKDSAPDCKAVAAAYATLQRQEIEKPSGAASAASAAAASETARQEAEKQKQQALSLIPAGQGGDRRGVRAEEVDAGDAALRGRCAHARRSGALPHARRGAGRGRGRGRGAGEDRRGAREGRRGGARQSARNPTAAREIRLAVTLVRRQACYILAR